jgi:hypothetical protein
MSTKYKILWFVVDMYHRERYFFICGCKQTLMKAGVKRRRHAVQEEKSSRFFTPLLHALRQSTTRTG